MNVECRTEKCRISKCGIAFGDVVLMTPGGEGVSQLYGFSLEKSIFDAGHVIMAGVGMIERDF